MLNSNQKPTEFSRRFRDLLRYTENKLDSAMLMLAKLVKTFCKFLKSKATYPVHTVNTEPQPQLH